MSTASVSTASRPIEAVIAHDPVELDEETLDRRRGRERKGRPVGRYMMCVHVTAGATQIAVLEGRSLIEHYVSHPSDDVSQIHGNVYLGRVQNVLPGMEAAFVDIGTPKNAVLYRGDLQYDPEDIEEKGEARIEHILRGGQRRRAAPGRGPPAAAVDPDRGPGQADPRSRPPVPGAGDGRPGHPGGV